MLLLYFISIPILGSTQAFKWMNGVLPAVESIHGVSAAAVAFCIHQLIYLYTLIDLLLNFVYRQINLYGIVLVGPGKLPKVLVFVWSVYLHFQ